MPSKGTPSEQTTSGEKQRNEEDDFEEPYEGQPSRSVYDFLYQDVRRVGSFLAQFEEYGVRQSVKATEGVGRTQTVKGSATGTVGLPAVLGASAILDATTADETKDLAEHTFDPLWSNSRRLLDYLADHDLIETDPWEATLGRFVLIEGAISIIDTEILKPVFADAGLFAQFFEQACVGSSIEPESPEGVSLRQGLLLAARMPSAIHVHVFKPGAYTWATLTSESLVTAAHDIAFKHGAFVRGEWNVLGILDAIPDHARAPTEDDPTPRTLDELAAEVLPDGLIKSAAMMTNIARNTLGRPRDYFGITPIMIFREATVRAAPVEDGEA